MMAVLSRVAATVCQPPLQPASAGGYLNFATEHKPRRGESPRVVWIQRLSCLRHFVRLVFELPRLKPGAGKLPPLRG